ncbi:MAG: hypothetical protein FD161_3087 [Limisphaerales bacterium]|nr:MAG: hypothetical protein FD161_3087 [Limisphaerales bacterium]KAG0508080.1 MAG: hypothetical protein E1N63_2794 [Limisphaerales bacterium]TXT52021.1 MAG: hypothetical protein FD140_1143 [Limisphaerales bacterium]
MNTDDKAVVMDLVNRMPESATLLDLARELEGAARLQAPAPRSASGWLIGQACREEWHRLARKRAVFFVQRMLPLFSHGRN